MKFRDSAREKMRRTVYASIKSVANQFLAIVTIMMMMMAAVFTATPASAQDQFRAPQAVTVAPVAPIIVTRAKPATLRVVFRVAEGFHINSNRPNSELLIPTTLQLDAQPKRLLLGKVGYPAGKEFTLPIDPTEKLNVYSGEVTLQVPIKVKPGAAAGTFPLKGELRYQACNDNSCFPPKSIAFDTSVTVGK